MRSLQCLTPRCIAVRQYHFPMPVTILLGVAGSRACSSGRNTLTSPELGFSVPMNATINSGQSEDKPAKPAPVAAISTPASISRRRCGKRPPMSPTRIVASAEPISVALLISPTANWPKPRPSGYAGRSTATNPSHNPRSARPMRSGITLASIPCGSTIPASFVRTAAIADTSAPSRAESVLVLVLIVVGELFAIFANEYRCLGRARIQCDLVSGFAIHHLLLNLADGAPTR
ncbi:protein of unknown function [Cupriavidus neocaledonicus]|uniref:Uncharacterized protein n=1 Tax=Cupriavidus neocaledonicus TaxID=1040979 RepID=A0A375H730_9BURK|nr:protein of unknown function [Cupriavidus neocaledonicus]